MNPARIAAALASGRANPGRCPVCERVTVFLRTGPWLREQYICLRCQSITRWRALMVVLERVVPAWRQLDIYECSPGGAGSAKIAGGCARYVGSHFHPGTAAGTVVDGYRCEDLEALSFADQSFDVVVTQDVLEHILRPERAAAEIARVLRPGGVHVFTVPFRPEVATVRRATIDERGCTVALMPEEFHGNPVDPGGSLVITDWGADLPAFLHQNGGLTTTIHRWQDRWHGIAGDLEVFVSAKG